MANKLTDNQGGKKDEPGKPPEGTVPGVDPDAVKRYNETTDLNAVDYTAVGAGEDEITRHLDSLIKEKYKRNDKDPGNVRKP
jgi:hypothetical protein